MSNVTADLDTNHGPVGVGLGDQIDEALAGLPAPPRARVRVLAVLLTAISVVSVALAWQLKDDVRYAFSSRMPIELGAGSTADVASVSTNRAVHLRGSPQMAGAVQYERPFLPGEHVVFPIAGRSGEPLYVQVDPAALGSGDFDFVGRMIPFSAAGGRYARVGRFLRTALGAPIGNKTYLIVAGVSPQSLWWAPLLASLLLALAVSDLLLLARLVAPLRHPRTSSFALRDQKSLS